MPERAQQRLAWCPPAHAPNLMRLPVGRLAALAAFVAPLADAQSSCAAGTVDLNSDGVCHQCFSSVPPGKAGRLQQDVSATLANSAAGCAHTYCFACASHSYVTTAGAATGTNVATTTTPGCSSKCCCVALCPGVAMSPPVITHAGSCALPPSVTIAGLVKMSIAVAAGPGLGNTAVYTCVNLVGTVSAPLDGDATRTCQAVTSGRGDAAWSGTAPSQC